MIEFKRILSFLMALVLLVGMVPPVSAGASEVEVPETEAVETTAVPETLSAETTLAESEASVPAETVTEETVTETTAAEETTVPEETAVPETTLEATLPEETAAETVPETEPEKAGLVPEGYTPPQIPDYWYVTEETYTWTEEVTVVEPNEDGSYRMYDTTQTFSETYYQHHEMGGEAEFASLTQYDDNTYHFTEFADLEELAGRTYDSHTVALYTGTQPLTIQRSITLPLNLQLQFSSEDSSLIIPEGVTFANTNNSGSGSIYLAHLTVAGTFHVFDYVRVRESLNVTGQMMVMAGELILEGGATVSGSKNVTLNGGMGARWWFLDITSEQGMRDAVAAANSDATGWRYLLEINTNNGDVTLGGNLTIPENVQLNTYGSGSFVVASGATLTMKGFYGWLGSAVVVNGSLVNNTSSYMVVDGSVTVNGSYSGTGALMVNKSNFNAWTDAVTGLDETQTSVTSVSWDSGTSWWKIRDINGMTRLGTPTNVAWNKRVVNTSSGDEVRDAKGHIYWKTAQPDDYRVVIRFYDYDTDELIRTWNCGFGGQSSDERSVDAFITIDPPSGTYYFTVTSMPQSGSDYYNSNPATSGKWTYTQTGAVMPQCTDLEINWPKCTWTDPAAADEYTTHCIEVYYSSTEDGTPVRKESNFGFTGTTTQFNQGVYLNCGAGWYSFRVRAIPDDITQYRVGEWSEMSEAFYFDPETFVFNETWITEHTGTGPEGTGIEKFVATNGNSVRLENDYTIPEGVVMDINGGTVTVPAGKTLTVNGDRLAIYYGGKLLVEEGGTLILNTEIQLYATDGTVDNQGTIVFSENAAVVNFHKNGNYGGEIYGVPEEKKILAVQLYNNPLHWEAGFTAFEESEGYGWTSLGINGNVVLSRDLESPAYSNIVFYQNSSLTVSEGCTLSIGEKSNIYLQDSGTLINNGTIEFCGPDSGTNVYGSVTNNGTMELKEGVVEQWVNWLNIHENAVFTNNGTVTVNPWTDLCADGKWEGNAPDNQGGDVYGASLSLTQAQFTAAVAAAKKAGTEYVLDKAVTITKSMKLDYPVTVNNSGRITVQKGATLTVNKTMTLYSGADLQIQEGAKLVNNTTIYSNTTAESYGSFSVNGTYTPGENAQLKVTMNVGKASVYGIDLKYQTAYYRPADTEDVLEAMALEGYSTIEVWTDNLVLEEDLVIPENAVLIINPSWNDLQNGTRNDWVYLNSTVTVYGELHANAYYNGTPCNLEINGNVNVMPGGLMYVIGHVKNNGYIHVAVGGEYIRNTSFGGTWTGNSPQIDLSEQDLRDMIKAGQGRINLNNDIVLTDDLILSENVWLNINGSGSLTVPEGVRLTLNSTVSIWGGSLIVEEGGILEMNTYIDVYEGATVDVRGTAKVNNMWSFVRRSYDGGWLDCTINGIPKEHQSVSVHFSPYNADAWDASIDVVENNDYPIAFMIVTDGTVTLPRDLTIPENVLLHVDGGNTTFIIPEGVTLTNHGDMYVWNNNVLKNYGTFRNQRTINVYGKLYNYGEIQLDESVQAVESYFGVQQSGYICNSGTFQVNPNTSLWMMGTWEGNDPIDNGGHLTMGRYQGNSDGAYLSAGKALTLKVWDCIEGKTLADKAVTWSLPEEYAAYATLTAKGKLTARKVAEQVTIEAVATIKATREEVITRVHLFPSVTQLEILDGETVVNGKTVPVDVSEDRHTFSLKLYPLDLDTVELKDNWCSWTVSDMKKKAYAEDYKIENGVLTVVEPTGKTGTVTVKVSYNVGTKKTVSFKLNFGSFAESVEILNTETQLVSGSKLTLLAAVNPRYATKADVTWSLKDPADKAYVTLSKNTLKAKTVYDSHKVVLVATSKDGQASKEYPITILPKDTGILVLKKDGVNVTKTTVYVDLNTTTSLDLTAHTFGAEAEAENVTWKSSAPKVALVSGGRVTFLKKGSVTITAICGSRKATVTLKAAQLATNVTITGAQEVASGKAIQLKAALANAAGKKVTWSIVEGSEYGKISKSGKFTAAKNIMSRQLVTIRATAADGSGKYADFTVTIRPIAQGVQIYSEAGGTTLFSLRSDASWWARSNTTLRWDRSVRGDTLDLAADVFPFYGEDSELNAIQNVTWKSSSPKVAVIQTDADGNVQVQCRKAGTVTITATAADGSGKKISFKLKVV